MATYDQLIEAAKAARASGNLRDEAQLLQYAKMKQEETTTPETTSSVVPSAQTQLQRQPSPGFVPEMVAGTEQQMAEQSARNLQGRLGLAEPVVPPTREYAPISTRIGLGLAPTKTDEAQFLDHEYGQNNWIDLNNGKYLIKVGNKDNARWVLDNPKGFDLGDVAAFATNLPQFIAGASKALSMIPGPAGGVGKMAQMSGASAVASNLAGAVQDILFRAYTGQPSQMGEIAQRRAASAALETGVGTLIPVVGQKLASNATANKAIKSFYESINKEGGDAVKKLQELGVSPGNSQEIGSSIRQMSPAGPSASSLGDVIADIVNSEDRKLSAEAAKNAGRAGLDASARAKQLLEGQGLPVVKLSPSDAGNIVKTGAVMEFNKTKQSLDTLFNSAMDDIAASAKARGVGTDFVELSSTRKAINDIKKNSLKYVADAEEEAVEEGAVALDRVKLKSDVEGLMDRLGKAVDTPQELMAVRTERSRIGEFLAGNKDLFPGMTTGAAKKIYAALSADIDTSISKLSGSGAQKLQQYNNLYRATMELVDNNKLISKLVNGGFENPEDVVKAFSKAGTADWEIASKILPARTLQSLKGAVIDQMKGDATIDVVGQKLINVPRLVKNMESMDSTVREQLFGGKAKVDTLRGIAREYEFLSSKGGLFTTQELPTMAQLDEATNIAAKSGILNANNYLKKAFDSSKARRNGMAESLISQTTNGNYTYAARNPEELLDSVVFNDSVRPEALQKFINNLPPNLKTDLGNRTFQMVFDNARDVVNSSVKGTRDIYNVDQVVRNVFGNKQRENVMLDLIGADRMDALKAWVALDTKFALEAKKEAAKKYNLDRIAGLIAMSPYPTLFASRAASLGLETAAGVAFAKAANPLKIQAFPQARQAMMSPVKTAAGIAAIQRAINEGGKDVFDNYNSMMDTLSADQQTALNEYLFYSR